MFAVSDSERRHSLTFIASFHLGIPLAIYGTKKLSNWYDVKEALLGRFRENPDRFQVAPIEYPPQFKFPLGSPVMVKHLAFRNLFNLPDILKEEGYNIPSDKCDFENLIWICPIGVVLIMVRLTLDHDIQLQLREFEKVVEKHYAEIALIYTELAENTFEVIDVASVSSCLCCTSDIAKCKEGITLRKQWVSGRETIPFDETEREKLEDILIDVYYIDFHPSDEESFQIGYVDTTIKSSDSLHVLAIGIAYSSFAGLLWIQKQLGERATVLQQELVSNFSLVRSIQLELKLFRILCLQYLTESSPINVRLTLRYMERIEDCWTKFRMHSIVEQINTQLATLEKMFDWISEIRTEIRNSKIGLAGIILALMSIAAVAAQLISTIDIHGSWGSEERVFLILVGICIGVLGTLLIYFVPSRDWKSTKASKRK